MTKSGSPWGQGLSQDDLMVKDECILLDENDNIIGHGSKKQVHTFSAKNPRGQLHRAFSVFLFNEEGKLLLQQRADEKITFPSVWTNTCCSHPLYGFEPTEVDKESDAANGKVNGVKRAAIRKLEHELGIHHRHFALKDFKYLTRLHYWAADVVTHGKSSVWGEHEIDYILFVKKAIKVKPNPEEVKDYKYVSLEELQSMMDPASGLLWSPWFRIIAEKFLVHWWKDLNETLTTDKFVDFKTIYRFDPTEEHMGGAGNADEWLGVAESPYSNNDSGSYVGDQSLKQGSYGKVKIHKHSKLGQLARIDEVFAALYCKYGGALPNKVEVTNESVEFCDEMLGKVSRSFAAVIRQLPKGLCLDITIFYLALRALDTVEDDMEAFKGKEEVKINHLKNFYRVALVTDGWSMDGVGQGDERLLLQQYYHCVTAFKSLRPASQDVIADITRKMGEGMAYYVSVDLGQGTVTVEDYNKYCHFVAGLVGEGLSRLFTCSGYESYKVAEVSTTLANTMGLFLQKTNIIRDYLEDYVDGRAFWPQEIWKLYSKTDDLGAFAKGENIDQALSCLNHLVTDALKCIPECLDYMDLLHTEEVFRFCAIPQVMAIATLAELYNNEKVFTGVVKIRKGMAAKLILDTKTRGGLHKWFYLLCSDILKRIPPSDPNAKETEEICNKVIKLTKKEGRIAVGSSYAQVLNSISAIVLAISVYNLFCRGDSKNQDYLSILHSKEPKDMFFNGLFFASSCFIFCYGLITAGQKRLKQADKEVH